GRRVVLPRSRPVCRLRRSEAVLCESGRGFHWGPSRTGRGIRRAGCRDDVSWVPPCLYGSGRRRRARMGARRTAGQRPTLLPSVILGQQHGGDGAVGFGDNPEAMTARTIGGEQPLLPLKGKLVGHRVLG